MAIIDEQNIFGRTDLNKTSEPNAISLIVSYSYMAPYGLSDETLSAIRQADKTKPGPLRATGNMGYSLATINDNKHLWKKWPEWRNGLENLRPLVTDDFLNKTLKAVVDDRTGIRTQQAIQNRIKPNHNKSV